MVDRTGEPEEGPAAWTGMEAGGERLQSCADLVPRGRGRMRALEVWLPPARFSLLPAPALSPLPSIATPPWLARGWRAGSGPGARKG